MAIKAGYKRISVDLPLSLLSLIEGHIDSEQARSGDLNFFHNRQHLIEFVVSKHFKKMTITDKEMENVATTTIEEICSDVEANISTGEDESDFSDFYDVKKKI